jgi:tRNA nucleotidyltransferase (CCA-adding enzyme)
MTEGRDPVLPPGARVHLVGGAVRDRLMGVAEGDRDWVVVGTTPEQMSAAGFRPVGLDFPVFLHPRTQEEHALARTERKSGQGYHGFVFHTGADVTLEQDLARRDLTINAMALDADGQTVIDPWGGRADLAARVLRHVGPAFAEDPVRILRLARFAARWPDFRIAPETLALCRQMSAAGEVDALVAERVWQELARGLMAPRPSRLLQVLREAGALVRLLPEVDRLYGVPQRADHHPEVDTGVHVEMVLDQAARLGLSLAARFAALTHDLGKGTTPADILPRHIGHEGRSAALLKPLCERLRVPVDCRELADLVAREHGNVHASASFDAPALVRLMDRCDAWRRPERFEQMLQACEADARGRLGLEDRAYPQAPRLRAALAAAQALDGREVVAAAQARGLKGPALGQALHEARVGAVATALDRMPPWAGAA